MIRTRVEYVGFSVDAVERTYVLRASLVSGESRDFAVAIPNEAFTHHRVRYQDGPEICYLKLQREVAECGDHIPALRLRITEQDLDRYRRDHAPALGRRRSLAP